MAVWTVRLVAFTLEAFLVIGVSSVFPAVLAGAVWDESSFALTCRRRGLGLVERWEKDDPSELTEGVSE